MLRTPKLILLAVLLLAGACSPKVKVERVSDDFDVKVSSGGKEIKDFNEKLVHHVSITSERARAMHMQVLKSRSLPFKARLEKDTRGAVHGVKIEPPKSVVSNELGIESMDVLTAVDSTQLRSLKDLQMLFQSLDTNKRASVTLLRRGRPHKILYAVAE